MCDCDTETGCSKPKEVTNAVGAVLNMFCDLLNAREHENSSKAHGIGNDGKARKKLPNEIQNEVGRVFNTGTSTEVREVEIFVDSGPSVPFPQNWSIRFRGHRGNVNLQAFVQDSERTPVPAVGSKVPVVEPKNGDNMSMTFAVMDVTAPLAAVSRMVKAGHTVVLSPNACKHQRA